MKRVKEWMISFFVILSWSVAAGCLSYGLYMAGRASVPDALGAAILFQAAGWTGGLALRSHWERKALKTLPASLRNSLAPLPSRLLHKDLCADLTEYYSCHKEFAAKQFIQNLLGDNGYTTEFEGVREKIGSILNSEIIDFPWAQFCIVYVVVDDYSAYMLKDRIDRPGGGIHLEDYRRMYETVMNSFRAQFNMTHRCHCAEYGQNFVCLINLRDTRADTPPEALEPVMDSVAAAANEVVRSMYEKYGITLEAAVSPPYSDIMESHNNCAWLISQLEYSRFVHRRTHIITAKDIPVPPPLSAPASTAQERRYIACLLSQNYDEAEQTLLQLVQQQAAQSGSISSLLNSAILRLRQLQHITPAAENEECLSQAIQQVSSAKDLPELQQRIHTVFQVNEELQNRQAATRQGTAQDIRDYINEHFRDPDLSNGVLADHFSLSQSYISRVFNREMGTNLPDYIHSLRIAEAKQLLSSTDLSISDISLKVGYTTAWTMNRAFKRYENMTPGAYRQLCRQSAGESAG